MAPLSWSANKVAINLAGHSAWQTIQKVYEKNMACWNRLY